MNILRLFIIFLFCIFSFSEAKGQYIVKIYVSDESTNPCTNIDNAIVLIDDKEKLRTGTDGMIIHLLSSGKHKIRVSHKFYEPIEFEVEKSSFCMVELQRKSGGEGRAGYYITTDEGQTFGKIWSYTNIKSMADSLYEIGQKYYDISIEAEERKEKEINYNKAISYFTEAAELNHPIATFYINQHFYENNLREEGLQWLQKVANNGNTKAMFYLGLYHLECKNYTLALELYQKGADLNDIDCQMELAEMYEKGLGVEKDINKAMKWYRMAKGVNDDVSTQLSIPASTKPLPILPQQKRLALLIGNSDYQTGRLLCVGKDVKDMKAKLEELGFETMYCPNVELMEFLQVISRFCKKAREGEYDAMLFYFAGHGIQCQGENYLVPIGDFYDDDILVKKMYIGMNDVLNETAKTGVKTRIFILDACREQPVAFTRSISKGLVGLGNTPGVFMAYSTMAGKTAKDNGGDGNSPYIKELLEELNVPQRPINDVFENVKRRVSQKTGGKQQPSHVNDLDVSNDEIIYLNRNNK
ncbi:Sel1 repeat-containing protein [Prevotella communis]|uniref:Sel1 repeat-containing protein n=1 Tax=Prevotella communis TaxID=2913614 RepID=A0A1H0EHG5_9BACT|nr:caspase family protein [Prevotella communis]SDN81761.1 Sel1 repeat-containing protein [Prevotella communis]